MKRYKLICGYCKTSGATTWKEDPNGEWVTWEDAQKEIRKTYESGYFTGQNSRIGSLELGTWNVCTCDTAPCTCGATLGSLQIKSKCNCEEMASKNWTLEVEGDIAILKGYWICPAHGYKKR